MFVPSQDDNRSSEPLAIGVEIGGRGQRVALMTSDGHILDSAHAIGYGTSAAVTIETICGQIDNILARNPGDVGRIQGIGVAFGGPVDAERGVTLRSHRVPGFEQLPLVSVLEERFGIRTILENDARAAAYGELTLGAGRGAQNMVYLHLGFGVGGAVIIDGKVHHGTSMTAGELGHMVVATDAGDGPRCSCGKPGHLEAYASVPAIIERMRLRLAAAPPESKAKWLASPGVTVKRVLDAASTDPDARSVVTETIHVIGLAAANLVTTLNPDAVIVGGEVALSNDGLTGEIRAKIRQYAFDPAARHVKVAVSQLGSDAGLVGSVMLAQAT